jgi:hypothetical protein
VQKIGPPPGREVVEDADPTTFVDQPFDEVGADEAGASGDERCPLGGHQGTNVISRHLSSARMSRRPTAAPSESQRATALSLRVDAITAEVVVLLRSAGIPSILLKGPALAAWLYADGAARPYVDSDLLVRADDRRAAEGVLREAGFRPGRPGWQEVSWSWRRASDGALVDLHVSLFSAEAAPPRLWEVLRARTRPLRVAGVEVDTPDEPALAFHVAVHAAQHGGEGGTPLGDLERALVVADERCWRQAAEIADALGAGAAFAAGLGLSPDGQRLARRLSLTPPGSSVVSLHARGAPPLVRGIEHLAAAPNWRDRATFAFRKLFPRPAQLRARSRLARSGWIGTALAYVARPVGMLARLPGALIAWRQARLAHPPQPQVHRADQVHGGELEKSDRR